MLVALTMSACTRTWVGPSGAASAVHGSLGPRRRRRNSAPGIVVSRAEDVAARPAAVAGVILHAYLVERNHELRGALGALHGWPGRREAGLARCRSESNSQCGLHRAPLRNRDRGPVGALDAVDVVIVRGIDVTPASGARLQQDQSLHSSRRHDADLYSACLHYNGHSSRGIY